MHALNSLRRMNLRHMEMEISLLSPCQLCASKVADKMHPGCKVHGLSSHLSENWPYIRSHFLLKWPFCSTKNWPYIRVNRGPFIQAWCTVLKETITLVPVSPRATARNLRSHGIPLGRVARGEGPLPRALRWTQRQRRRAVHQLWLL